MATIDNPLTYARLKLIGKTVIHAPPKGMKQPKYNYAVVTDVHPNAAYVDLASGETRIAFQRVKYDPELSEGTWCHREDITLADAEEAKQEG